MLVNFGIIIKELFTHYTLTVDTLLLRPWLGENIIQLRLKFAVGPACCYMFAQIVNGSRALIAVHHFGWTAVHQ